MPEPPGDDAVRQLQLSSPPPPPLPAVPAVEAPPVTTTLPPLDRPPVAAPPLALPPVAWPPVAWPPVLAEPPVGVTLPEPRNVVTLCASRDTDSEPFEALTLPSFARLLLPEVVNLS